MPRFLRVYVFLLLGLALVILILLTQYAAHEVSSMQQQERLNGMSTTTTHKSSALAVSLQEFAQQRNFSMQTNKDRNRTDPSPLGAEQTVDAKQRPSLTSLVDSRAKRRPSLTSLVDYHGKIIGDTQWLLDFAIIGFGKCGTSTLMNWLADHPEVQCFREEIWELIYNRPGNLVKLLYSALPGGSQYKRCYKCPAEITQPHILDYFRTLWPQTKLLVGIRAPISFFQSLYNFRVQNTELQEHMPDPNYLIGRCTTGMRHTCTEKANFAYNLIRLGKQFHNGTREPTELETEIVGHYRRSRYNYTAVPYMPNPIFLFDIQQLADTNETRRLAFQRDVQKFLGLKQPLPPMIHFRPGRDWGSQRIQKLKDSRKIDICRDEFVPVRQELMRLSKLSARWIREQFLDLPGVFVSSREYFATIMDDWMHDPCNNSTETASVTETGILDLKLPTFEAVPKEKL